jgi:endonuclease/exonuclease/phosphatase family metal-dependent hydrolase
MGFLGLGFPILFLGELFLLLSWLFINRKGALVIVLIMAAGSYQLYHSLAFHPQKFSLKKEPGTIRILCWNVQNFNTLDIWRDTANSIRHRAFRYIDSQQADIICMQDFTEFRSKDVPSNISMLADSLGFPYYAFSGDYQASPPWGHEYEGVAIFSKYPLQNARRFPFTGKKFPESVLIADMTIGKTTRRLVVTHLQSMHLRNLPPAEKMPWIRDEDTAINYSGSLYKKLAYYFPYHTLQAKKVRQVIDDSPYPVIFSADMNEVPTSYSYRKVKGDMKDAFLERGSGLGRTYYRISPTLRIDYIFTSPSVLITQFKKDETSGLSDHYPQVVDVKWE